MLRNDLINLLAEKDNDNVAACIGGLLIDVDGVTVQRGNIVLVLTPEDLSDALRRAASRSPAGENVPGDEVWP